jgi:hypothetical protein
MAAMDEARADGRRLREADLQGAVQVFGQQALAQHFRQGHQGRAIAASPFLQARSQAR